VLEIVVRDLEDHVAVHLDEAAIGVVRETGVAGLLGEALYGLVVEAEVENRVHHAGHRLSRAGTDGDEERVDGIAQLLAHGLLEAGEVLGDLGLEAVGVLALVLVVRGADIGRYREARGYRNAEVRHLGEVSALATELFLHLSVAFGLAVAEIVHVLDLSHRVESSVQSIKLYETTISVKKPQRRPLMARENLDFRIS
jgi:hypothetical protein